MKIIKYALILFAIFITTINYLNPTYSISIYGNSMEPNIHSGDVVVIEEIKSEKEIKEGDVILYHSIYGENNLHRVDKILEDNYGKFFLMKGDNNKGIDAKYINNGDIYVYTVRFEQVMGRVT